MRGLSPLVIDTNTSNKFAINGLTKHKNDGRMVVGSKYTSKLQNVDLPDKPGIINSAISHSSAGAVRVTDLMVSHTESSDLTSREPGRSSYIRREDSVGANNSH